MNQIIEQIKTTLSGLRKGKEQGKPNQSSVTWFSKKLQNIKTTTKGKVNPQTDSLKKKIISEDDLAKKAFKYRKPGYIYFFNYQPPNAKNMPFYDRFPLVLTLGFGGTTMLGLNLHYIPPRIRLGLLLRILKSMSSNPKQGTKIKINSLLSNTLFVKYIMASSKLGLERYDMRGIRSNIKLIAPEDFVVMAFLPVQKFAKKTDKMAYKILNNIIRGNK